jgi:hypothetical protein
MISAYIKQDTDTLNHFGFQYLEFLRILDTNLRPSTYFEIGTSEGNSLAAFTCDAVCVDPTFRIQSAPALNRGRTFFLQMTSDAFFRSYGVRHFFPSGPDICFLDGLHRFEFLLRDFINTEAACRRNSIILMHDCLPTNERMAERTNRLDESEHESTRHSWTGDVWRILPALRQYRPDLRIILLDCGPTGLVAVTRLDSDSRVLKDNYDKIVDDTMNLPLSGLGLKQLWRLFPTIETRRLVERPEDITAVFNIA